MPALRLPVAILACLATLQPGLAGSAETAQTRYVQATELRLRDGPQTAAATVAQLRINEPVVVNSGPTDGSWCHVSARADAVQGWLDCGYLSAHPLTLDQLGQEVARATLALHRAIKVVPGFPPVLDGSTHFDDAKAARGLLENLFTLLERHFALSPSLHTLADYDSLLALAGRLEAAQQDEPALKSLAEGRRGGLARMRQQLVKTNTTQAWPSARYPAAATLRSVLAQREPSKATRRAARRAEALARAADYTSAAPRTSFFHDGTWAVGWAGGPLVQRQQGHDGRRGLCGEVRWGQLSHASGPV
jgi:hypothetical protein